MATIGSAVGTWDGRLRICDIQTKTVLHSIEHTAGSTAFSPTDPELLVAGAEPVALSPDGQSVVTIAADETALLLHGQSLSYTALSSDEFSTCLRDVDAAEIVLIVVACHSEATVNTDGFKSGPMRSRGLGQLAYDKGMQVVAASKAQEAVIERGGKVRQGLLTCALVRQGLEQGGRTGGQDVLPRGMARVRRTGGTRVVRRGGDARRLRRRETNATAISATRAFRFHERPAQRHSSLRALSRRVRRRLDF